VNSDEIFNVKKIDLYRLFNLNDKNNKGVLTFFIKKLVKFNKLEKAIVFMKLKFIKSFIFYCLNQEKLGLNDN
jgi:hypothetical protein